MQYPLPSSRLKDQGLSLFSGSEKRREEKVDGDRDLLGQLMSSYQALKSTGIDLVKLKASFLLQSFLNTFAGYPQLDRRSESSIVLYVEHVSKRNHFRTPELQNSRPNLYSTETRPVPNLYSNKSKRVPDTYCIVMRKSPLVTKSGINVIATGHCLRRYP